jgi:hypothetical protein
VNAQRRDASPRATPAALCGREREEEALCTTAQRAAAGEPQRVVLSGEAGSGKTYLLRYVLAGSGMPTAWGDTSEFGNGEFGPLKDLLRRLVREHPREAARLRSSHPLLLQLLSGPSNEVPEAPSREALFDGLAQGVLSLGATHPFAIVFDDLHVADHATIELLARVADRLDGEKLLLLLVHRSDDLPRAHPLRRLRQQWRRGGGVQEIELAPLAPMAILELATRRLGSAPGPALAADLQRLCGGLPSTSRNWLRRCLRRGPSSRPGTAWNAHPLRPGRCPSRCATRCCCAWPRCPRPRSAWPSCPRPRSAWPSAPPLWGRA